MTLSDVSDENVNFNLTLNGNDVIAALNKIIEETNTFQSRVDAMTATIQAFASSTGKSFDEVLGKFKLLDAELSKSGKSSLFGSVGNAGFSDVQSQLDGISQTNNAMARRSEIYAEMNNASEYAMRNDIQYTQTEMQLAETVQQTNVAMGTKAQVLIDLNAAEEAAANSARQGAQAQQENALAYTEETASASANTAEEIKNTSAKQENTQATESGTQASNRRIQTDTLMLAGFSNLKTMIRELNTEDRAWVDSFETSWQGADTEIKQQGVLIQGITSLMEKYNVTAQQAGMTIQRTWNTNPAQMNEIVAGFKDAESAAKGFAGGIDVVNTALGALTAMLVFQVIGAIITTFTNAIGYANQYYNALFQISVAQDVLARGGMNITQQQLVDTAKQLETEWKIISETDALTLVSQTALLAQHLGFSADQMKLLGEYAITLSVQLTGSAKDSQRILDELVRGIEQGAASPALKKLGEGFSSADVKAEALRLHLIEQGQALDDNSKYLATFSIIQQKITPEYEKMVKLAGTLPGQAQEANKAWSDFLKDLGTLLDPIKIALQKTFGEFLIVVLIPALHEATKIFSIFVADFVVGIKAIDDAVHGHFKSLQEYQRLIEGVAAGMEKLFTTGKAPSPDTPIGPKPTPAIPSVDTQKVQKELDTFYKDLVAYQDNVQKAEENFILKMQNMDENYQLQRQKTIQDYNNSVQKERENYQLKIQQQTQAHYQKLRDLQTNFLFSLEDALRNRDALSVLKLTEKYNIDVNKENQAFKIQQENDAKNEALKLAQMKRDEELRLQQQAAAYALQKKQAQEAYDLQKEQAKRAEDEKIQQLAQAIATTLGLNAQGAEAIYKLLNSYYGQNGFFDGLYNYSFQSMVARSQQMLQALQNIAAQAYGMMSSFGAPTVSSQGGGNIGKQASGGAYLANSATSAVFGEAGPELAIFAPLNGGGMPSFGMSAGASGGGGLLHVIVDMHPDLIGRIVDSSMNATAEVVTRLNRSN